jgi:predicted RNA binding protein YcfA (HicA-like mRNA interferase family)
MNRKEKLLERFKQNPESIRYSELKTILTKIGFEEIPAKGSHTKWKHPMLTHDLIIPIHNHDCKGFYEKHTLKVLQTNDLL